MKQFSFLSTSEIEALANSKAELMYSNANESFNICFFRLNGVVFEVCFSLEKKSIEDIRIVESDVYQSASQHLMN